MLTNTLQQLTFRASGCFKSRNRARLLTSRALLITFLLPNILIQNEFHNFLFLCQPTKSVDGNKGSEAGFWMYNILRFETILPLFHHGMLECMYSVINLVLDLYRFYAIVVGEGKSNALLVECSVCNYPTTPLYILFRLVAP